MELLNECLCDGQLDELIHFLQTMNIFTFVVTATNQGITTSLTNNTLKELSGAIRDNCVICPVHNCNINVDNLLAIDEYKYKNINKKQKYKK